MKRAAIETFPSQARSASSSAKLPEPQSSASATLTMTSSGSSGINPSAFAEDANGELYLLDYSGGGFYQLTVLPGA